MKLLIVGCLGMLGSDLMQVFSSQEDVLGLDLPDIDISDPGQCKERVQSSRPEVIINAAAMTDVDSCETHESQAVRVNGNGPGHLADAAAEIGALLVHYSTDYVFDGQKAEAYCESDPTAPMSAYGRSKLIGEELVRSGCQDHLIIRTSWAFGRNGKNFIRTIVGAAREGRALRVVNDQRGCPTYTRDLASHTALMLNAGCRGTYHVTNSGSCTWYELAVRALECAGLECVPVTPVTTGDFPRPAKRPANSVLSNSKLQREGLPLMRPWPIAAREYINNCGLRIAD
jgi:dTDP-4-dehydrorhamnose reductase